MGEGISPSFPQVLKLLLAEGEFLAFAPDTDETNNMIDILSLKFPELRVSSLLHLMLLSRSMLLLFLTVIPVLFSFRVLLIEGLIFTRLNDLLAHFTLHMSHG